MTAARYRSDLDELVRLANRDLAALWRLVGDGVQAREMLTATLPMLGDAYGAAAASLAADWYDDLRDEAAVPGRFRARVAAPEIDRSGPMARWAVEPLFTPEPDFGLALRRVEGGLQRMIADAGRETVMGSSIADPSADGWQRVTSGGCGFCQMLADRGAVYSELSVQFGAHDNCRCVAVPAFGGRERPVKPHLAGHSTSTPADRARTRRWMAAHGYLD